LNVIPLGHRTYLKAKARGENSMFGKAGSCETTKQLAGRGPDGMVKAIESQESNVRRSRGLVHCVV
jgi:hypothetical protein